MSSATSNANTPRRSGRTPVPRQRLHGGSQNSSQSQSQNSQSQSQNQGTSTATPTPNSVGTHNHPLPKTVNFTFVLDSESRQLQVHRVTLTDDKTVKDIRLEVQKVFGIALSSQFLCGWPIEDESKDSSVLIRDLKLTSDEVFLQVSKMEPVVVANTSQALSGSRSQSGGRSNSLSLLHGNTNPNDPLPYTSTSSQSAPAASGVIPNLNTSVVISLFDDKNGMHYPDLEFQGQETVKNVKEKLTELTNISKHLQDWYGWPDNITENSMLKDIPLDKPIHSLELRERVIIEDQRSATRSRSRKPSAGKPPPDEISNSKNKKRSHPDTPVQIPSVSKLRRVGNKDKSGSSSGSSGDHIRIVEDGEVPGPSRPLTEAFLLAESSTTKKIGINPDAGVEAAPIVQDIVKIETKSPPLNQSSPPVAQIVNVRSNQVRHRPALHSPISQTENTDSASVPVSNPMASTLCDDFTVVETQSQRIKNKSRKKGSEFLDFLKRDEEIKINLTKNNGTITRPKATVTLLKYLDASLQLSLRRVCKATKSMITRTNGNSALNSFREEEKWSCYRLHINGVDFKCFETVVNMNLPITRYKFDLDFWGECFYDRPDVQTFIVYFGVRVKEVTISNFFMFQNPNERALFESFISLEKLTIERLELVSSKNANLSTPRVSCPSTLANLKILKLNYTIITPSDNSLTRPTCWDFTWGMLSDCSSLMYFRFPRVEETKVNPIGSNVAGGNLYNYGIFTPLMNYITEREQNCGVSIEYLDLKHFTDSDSLYINRFVQVLRKCHSKDIKMKNVNSNVIQIVLDDEGNADDKKYTFCENILSIINYTPFCENGHFRNLEKITLDVIPSVRDYRTSGRPFKDIFWPKLKTIKIIDTVQCSRTDRVWNCWQEVQEDLYGHNKVYDRGSVQYLKIDSPKVPYFLGEGRLAKKFYNLRRLEIVSWFKDEEPSMLNKRLLPIWKKLKLEELTIKKCPSLNDNTFIGEENEESKSEDDDERIIIFHQLIPTLKKLTLDLDGVDGVTDRSFMKVFSQMKLKQFIVLSTTPTQIGEAALLEMKKDGMPFGKHIEYFPFHCWSSSRISSRRFARLGKEFRSLR